MLMHDMFKKKYIYIYIYAKNIKAKIIKCFKKMVASVFLGDVGVIRCISKVIVPIKQL